MIKRFQGVQMKELKINLLPIMQKNYRIKNSIVKNIKALNIK